jgi:hypothetical protein
MRLSCRSCHLRKRGMSWVQQPREARDLRDLLHFLIMLMAVHGQRSEGEVLMRLKPAEPLQSFLKRWPIIP